MRFSKKIIILLVCVAIIGGASLWFTKEKQPPLFEPEKNIERKIEMEIEGLTIRYQENKIWNGNYFHNTIVENQTGVKSALIDEFNETYNVSADNFEVEFEEESKSTLLKCYITDEILKTGDKYTATLLWFLDPLKLDFIDNDFRESKESLAWNGKINSISTTIKINLPPQESVYEAWDEPIGHCHGHVWWPE